MFLRYIDFIFVPFRQVYNQIMTYRNLQGNFRADVIRAKHMGDRVGMYAKDAKDAAGKVGQMAGKLKGGNVSARIETSKFLFWTRRTCSECKRKLKVEWPTCPFCGQAKAAAGPILKTQAFVIDASGRPSGVQLMGWLVPLQGEQRGELFTLLPLSVVGNDPACTVCLRDRYMSAQHAEIRAEGGHWVLKDLGSTNGTYVNNKRVERHELVDNDFVKFGAAVVKFKCL